MGKADRLMTNIELIILGLVAEEASHGYRIEAEIRARNISDWAAIGFSSIYYVLNRLEKRQLLVSRARPSPGGPDRRVFSVTAAGLKVLRDESRERLVAVLPLPHTFYIGLAHSKHLAREQLDTALADHAREVTRRLQRLAGLRCEEHPPLAEAMFDLGERLARTEADWLKEFRAMLDQTPHAMRE